MIRKIKLAVVLGFVTVGTAMAILHWVEAFHERSHVPAIVSPEKAGPSPGVTAPAKDETRESVEALPRDFYGMPESDDGQ